jgi:hypothetical protein
MTAKEKAKELVDEFQRQIFFYVTDDRIDIEESKGCALIAVDEVLQLCWNGNLKAQQYWMEVKQEIEKL